MKKLKADVVVLGAGPGGYAAAFYASDKGKNVILIDKGTQLGGVCLNRGCIPSKALINATSVMEEAMGSDHRGISFSQPKIDLKKIRAWKDGIITTLATGIRQLAKKRNVELLAGKAHFESPQLIRVELEKGQVFVEFETAIIAVGSRPALPSVFDLGSQRIMTSTEALELSDIPQSLLVIGGGYIGMELGTVYANLGSKITVVEAMGSLLAGADPDLVRPVMKKAKEKFSEIHLSTKVVSLQTEGKHIKVNMVGPDQKTMSKTFDKVLVSIGRTPNSDDLGLSDSGIEVDDRGFIKVNTYQQTSVSHIYAIGDISGGILLAHKASKEAKIAVDHRCESLSNPISNEDINIPAVVFTDPEVAWVGLTETEAKSKGIKVNVAKFSWGASGKALAHDRTDGLTKLILEPETDRVLGVGIVGIHAGDLISEGVLAVEMGANAEDLAFTVHPHPTLSETIMESAEAFYGHSAHVFSPKK